MEIELKFERETKNKLLFVAETDNSPIESIYILKSAVPDDAKKKKIIIKVEFT